MSQSDLTKKQPLPNSKPSSAAYSVGDPIPVADVTESDTDTAWDLFEELADPKTDPLLVPEPFADTVPADLELLIEPSHREPIRKKI